LLISELDIRITTHSFPPHLLFDGRPVVPTPCPLLVRATTTFRPIFAFIDKTWLSDQRYKVFGHKPVKTVYRTVQQMNKLEFDPYYAGLLISMTQNSCSFTLDDEIEVMHLPTALLCITLIFSYVHLFSPSTSRKSLIQYSANVSRQYLRKFDNTYKSSSSRLTITQKEMPFNRPNVIIEALRKIGKLCACSPGDLVSRNARPCLISLTASIYQQLPKATRPNEYV
jgi:hypothetical protein